MHGLLAQLRLSHRHTGIATQHAHLVLIAIAPPAKTAHGWPWFNLRSHRPTYAAAQTTVRIALCDLLPCFRPVRHLQRTWLAINLELFDFPPASSLHCLAIQPQVPCSPLSQPSVCTSTDLTLQLTRRRRGRSAGYRPRREISKSPHQNVVPIASSYRAKRKVPAHFFFRTACLPV